MSLDGLFSVMYLISGGIGYAETDDRRKGYR